MEELPETNISEPQSAELAVPPESSEMAPPTITPEDPSAAASPGPTEPNAQAPSEPPAEAIPVDAREAAPSGIAQLPLEHLPGQLPTIELAEPAASSGATQAAPPETPAAVAKVVGPRIGDLKAGMVMEGTVTRIEKYGAFVNLALADRRDGLIHISELAQGRIRRVEDIVRVGDPVRARVVSVDLERGRIALSLNDVDALAESYSDAQSGSSEPAMSSMALAFREAYGEARERTGGKDARNGPENAGARKKREHEELMRRLQSSGH